LTAKRSSGWNRSATNNTRADESGKERAESTYKTRAYSAASATSPLASTTIARRDPTENDVLIEILFCGICLCLRPYHGPPEPLWLKHRRYPGDPGDARLLWRHNITADVESSLLRDQRSLRETAQVRCEVPLLDRYWLLSRPSRTGRRRSFGAVIARRARQMQRMYHSSWC